MGTPGASVEEDVKEWVIQQAAALHTEFFGTGAAAAGGSAGAAGGVMQRLGAAALALASPANRAADAFAVLVEIAAMLEETSAGASAFEVATSQLIPRCAC
jgi:hypothetical protein